jgi:hypothetical protein
MARLLNIVGFSYLHRNYRRPFSTLLITTFPSTLFGDVRDESEEARESRIIEIDERKQFKDDTDPPKATQLKYK